MNSMRLFSIIIPAALIILGLLSAGRYSAQDTPKFDGTSIPVPPEQSQPWTPPPTKLAPVVVSAITELFDEGLSDPRGCEYREIEITWGESTIKTHGWVLPGSENQRFAVGWNGLVYPLKSMGKPVSLKDDFPSKSPRQSFDGLDNNWLVGEYEGLSIQGLVPIKAALLLRLGQAKLAEDFWKRGFAQHSPDLANADPYILMANSWLYALYSRAVGAHDSGDDAQALQFCRFLVPLLAKAEASAAQRGIAKPATDKLYFAKLEQLPELAADQERRAREAPYPEVLESGLPAEGPERIAALIRDLELVRVEQFSNPGQTDTYNDPIVQALVKEGDAAVEPLLKCWEEDTRLTRTRFTQGMGFGGPIVHVYEPAYIALSAILDKPFYFSDEDETSPYDFHQAIDPRDQHPRDLTLADRQFLGAKIRAYLDKYKGLTLADRWFADLKDDNAGEKAWIKAMERIAQPADQMEVSFGLYGGTEGWGFPTHAGHPVKGESLRAKTNPSVSDLIIKRTNQLMPKAGTDPALTFDHMGNLILALADWDGKAHLKEIRDFSTQFRARFTKQNAGFNSVNDEIISLFQRRIHLGDPLALQDYANWLGTLSRDDLSNPLQKARPFQIMWHYPKEPIMEQMAARLFTHKGTCWVPLPNDLVHTPLIGFAPFRRELLRGLSDTSPSGTVTMERGTTNYDFRKTGGTISGSPFFPQDTSDAPAFGTVTFRLCDCYAYQLSSVAGFPSFRLYWPVARRDAAVAACRAFLQQYGDAYQGHPDDPYDDTIGAPGPGTAQFFLPPLDHPATPEDVKAGRAIFSLTGTTRVWKMPTCPMGPAWQVEEVLVDGKWERYFGVIEKGKPVKVAATKIDLSGFNPFPAKVTPEISGEIGAPPVPDDREFGFMYGIHHSLAINAPVPINLDISNHSGLDVPVPGSLLLPPGAMKTLPAAMTLSVSYSGKLAPAVQRFTGPLFDPAPFHELAMLKGILISREQSIVPTLSPMQKLTVLKIDLRDFFDLSHPGTYRVKALFHVPGQVPSQSSEITFSIAGAIH